MLLYQRVSPLLAHYIPIISPWTMLMFWWDFRKDYFHGLNSIPVYAEIFPPQAADPEQSSLLNVADIGIWLHLVSSSRRTTCICWLVVGIPTPLKNDGLSSSVGMIVPFPTVSGSSHSKFHGSSHHQPGPPGPPGPHGHPGTTGDPRGPRGPVGRSDLSDNPSDPWPGDETLTWDWDWDVEAQKPIDLFEAEKCGLYHW